MIRKSNPLSYSFGPTVVLFFLGLATCSQTGFGQSWPVNSPEVYEPVPQYSPGIQSPQFQSPRVQPPRYPLTNEVTTEIDQTGSQPQELRPRALHPTASVFHPAERPLSQVNEDVNTDRAHGNWDIYRDRTATPVDPRKPCNRCTNPPSTQPRFGDNLTGVNGRPYRETEPGGCSCGQKHPSTHPEFSADWPRPFSAKIDEYFPAQAASRYDSCQKKRLVDMFDSLSSFKLINYQRTDNGYCGPGSDRYGCLGESK